MFRFSDQEKESMKYILRRTVDRHQTVDIYNCIDEDKLTKGELVALESKARQLLGVFGQEDRNPSITDACLIEIGANISTVLNALNRYRITDFSPDKYPIR